MALPAGTYYYNGGKVTIPANFNPTSGAAKTMVDALSAQRAGIIQRASVSPGGSVQQAAAKKVNPTNNAGYKPPAPAAPAKSVPKAPAPKAPSGSSGGGGGGDGGGGGGGYSGGYSAPAAPVMQDITIPDAAEDTDYKRTVSDLARAMTDFGAQQNLSRKQYDFGFGEAKRRMGWDETGKKFDRGMPGAYGDAVYANENDFAGRGLTWSGLFGKASGDINQEFADRGKSLDVARQDNIDTQNLAKNTFASNQDATKEAAKQNAISKIMAQLGVSANEVPVGTGSRVIQRQVIG